MIYGMSMEQYQRDYPQYRGMSGAEVHEKYRNSGDQQRFEEYWAQEQL